MSSQGFKSIRNKGTFVRRSTDYESCLGHVFMRGLDRGGININAHYDFLDSGVVVRRERLKAWGARQGDKAFDKSVRTRKNRQWRLNQILK